MITSIENLSNEIFYEIFDYIDGCKLYEAFSGLNTRFQHLLNASFLQLKISLLFYMNTNIQHHYMNIISEQRQKIISFRLVNASNINLVFTSMTFDSSFQRLESLSLIDIQSKDLLQHLPVLTSLPRLFSLTLLIRKYLENLTDVYRLIFTLPVLKNVKVSCDKYDTYITLPIATNNQFSPITHLNINHSCRLNDVIVMLSYTPGLRYLSCTGLIGSNENIRNVTLSLPSLTHVYIRSYRLRFDEFERFIKKISCQLQVLRTVFYVSTAYLDADRWERLISEDMPYLRRFHFQHSEFISNGFNVTEFNSLINRFSSLFWIERQWISHLSINIHGLICKEIIFSIHPYKKGWNELSEYVENDTYYKRDIATNQIQHAITSMESQTDKYFVQTSLSTEIIVDCSIFDECETSILRNIDPIVTVIMITHLNIRNNGFFIDMFFQILLLLPDLNSLKISFLSLMEVSKLSDDELETFYLISSYSKITEVVFEKMTDLNQVQFFIDLCPRMKYLEVHCSNNIDFKSLVHRILVENLKYIPYLRALCVNIPTANDKLIEELQQMIKFEKLPPNYRITRLYDKIYFQWI